MLTLLGNKINQLDQIELFRQLIKSIQSTRLSRSDPIRQDVTADL